MAKIFTPLAPNVPIVDENGNPTPYFQRIMQELSDARINASLIDALGGDPDEDAVVTWDDTAGALAFVPNDELLTLNDLTDVDTAGVADGDVLTYDSGGGEWVAAPSSATGFEGCVCVLSGDKNLNHLATGAINFDGTNEWDTGSYHSGISSTVTITIASPGVVTWTGHTFVADQPVVFSTTGALPTGLTAGTTYYVRSPAANTFQVATAPNGASINTSGTQSGVHTAANHSRVIIPSTGVYLVTATAQNLNVATNEFLRINLKKNGVGTTLGGQWTEAAVAVQRDDSFATMIALDANDYIEVWLDFETDTATTLQASGTRFGVLKLA